MPGLLVDRVPFQRREDPELTSLLATLRHALDPDGVDLEFSFAGSTRLFRRRFVGPRDSGARAVPKRRVETDGSASLAVSFGRPGLVEGKLVLGRRSRRPWTGAERMRFELLRPVVSQLLSALALAEIEASRRRWLLTLAEETEEPLLLFESSGTILFANAAADDLLSAQTETGLTVLSGSRREAPLLSHLMQMAWLEPVAGPERLALSNGRSLEARVIALPGDSDRGELPVRAVLLRAREALTIEDVRPQLMARGVSGREADVVSGVLRGLRNAEIATELFISQYTVKDHLKHVFAKLGVASRGGLIRALYSTPPGAGHGEGPSVT